MTGRSAGDVRRASQAVFFEVMGRRSPAVIAAGVLALLTAACQRAEHGPLLGNHAPQPPVTQSRPPLQPPPPSDDWPGFANHPGPVLVGHPVQPGELTTSELRFGVAPSRAPGIVYRDDIILMEHGDRAVRALNGNGLGCTFDAAAPQAAQFAVGRIVFATSRCVGRILAVQRKGRDVSLLLGPVQLTDLVKQGKFSYHQPLDLKSMQIVVAPDYPGAINSATSRLMLQAQRSTTQQRERPSASQGRVVAYYCAVDPAGEWRPLYAGGTGSPAAAEAIVWRPGGPGSGRLWLAQDIPVPGIPGMNLPRMPVRPADIARLAPGPAAQLINGMQMESCRGECGNIKGDGLGLRLYQEKDGVKVWVDAIIQLPTPRLDFDMWIAPDGSINAYAVLSGTTGFNFEFAAVASQDMIANLHEVGAIPVVLTIPLDGMHLPLTAQFQQSLRLDSGFRARTSVLHAAGNLSASGDIRLDYRGGGNWGVGGPNLRFQENLARSVGGLSMGINDLTFGIDQRLLVGVGTLGFATGPYVELLSRLGARKSASLGFDCRVASFSMDLGGGVGYSMPRVVAQVINFFLGLVHIKPIPASGSIVALKQMKRLITKDDYWPQIADQRPCNGA